MSKDPMWIPKPPVLYGSDKLEMFQPYDPETPANTTPPGSPSCPGSPSESSSSDSVTIPSLLTSVGAKPFSTSATVASTLTTSNIIPDMSPSTESSRKTPLQTILKSLFGTKQTDSIVPSDGSSTTTTTTTVVSGKKRPLFSQVSGPMIDPIVQQYGQKSKVKEIKEEENDFDRPYDPEEEYDPAMGYGMVNTQSIEKTKANGPAGSGFEDDDVAYDPEDETIFEDIQSDVAVKPAVPTQMSDPSSCPTPISTKTTIPAPTCSPAHTSSPAEVTQNLPTGTVVVSAATLTEQQRMLEELNKQIEEQKRQLKEQEEALRQQREAVGMFMAHFSVSDSLMSPPQKPVPVSQLSSLQSGIMQTESKPSEITDKTSNLTETEDSSNVDSQTAKVEETTDISNLETTDTVTEQDGTQQDVKESDKYSSAGEIEDSEVEYDPEDESLFNEIQEDVFQVGSIKTCDSSLSRTGHSTSHKSSPKISHHSRKRRLSPKRRSHRERDRHRSPSRKSQRRSPSHSQRHRERDRHRRSERDRSRHRARDQSERQSRHRKERTNRRHSHGHRRSPSSPGKTDSTSLSPKWHRPSPQLGEKPPMSVTIKNDPDGHELKCNLVEIPDKDCSPCSHELLHNVKLEISELPTSQELQKNSVSVHDKTATDFSTQLDKPSQQQTMLKDKVESTVPLREIDPPIRDSPQSPDPEPQFVKPTTIEKLDCVKTEEIRDPEAYTNASMPLGGGPISNVRYLDFKAQQLQGPGVRGQGIIEAGQQIEGESSGLKHPEILSQVGRHLNPTPGLDIQGSGPELDRMTKLPGSGVSCPNIRNPGPDVKALGHWGPQINVRETGGRFPGPDMRGPGINPGIWVPGSQIQGLAMSGQEKYMKEPATGMQSSETNMGEAGIQHHSPDIIGLRPVMKGFGLRNSVQHMESSSMQGVNPEVKGTASDVRSCEAVMRGQMLLPDVPNIHMGGTGQQNERRDKIMKGPFLDRPDHNNRGLGLKEPLLGLDHPSPSFRGRVQKQSRHDSSPVLEDRGPPKRGAQPHGRDADLSRVGGGRERSLDSHTPAGSEGTVLIAERLSPAMTDNRHGPQIIMGMVNKGHVQNMDGMGGSDARVNRSESHARSSGRDIRETGSNWRDTDMQERTIQGLRLERRSEQIGQDVRDPTTKSTNSDWGGRGPGFLGPEIRGPGPQMRDSDWSVPGSDIQHHWRGPDRVGLSPVSGGPFGQNERRVHQPDRAGSNVEDLRHEIGGPGGPTFMTPGPERRDPDIDVSVHNRRGPGGPDFMGPGLERRGSNIEVPGHNRRGPEGPDFRRPVPEGRGPNNDGPDLRGPGGPEFVGPGFERRGLPMEVPGPNRGGSAGPDFSRPWPERRGHDIGGFENDMQGPDDPNFSEPGPNRRALSMEGPGHERRGPLGPDFRGPGHERRGPLGPDFRGPGHERRGPGGPDFRRPGPESRDLSMEGPGPARRGSGGPDFRGPGPDRRNASVEGRGPAWRGPGGPDFKGPGPERNGPGGPDFRGPVPESRHPSVEHPGPDRRSFSMEHPGPDSRRPGGPDFRGPGPDRRIPVMEAPGADKRGAGGPAFSGPAPDRIGLSIVGQGPDRRVLEHEKRGPALEAPRPDRRGPGGPNFSGPGHERRGRTMDSQEPDRRGPRGPDFHGQVSERRDQVMDGPGHNKRGQGGPDIGVPGCDWRGPPMQGQGPDRRGSGDLNTGGLGPGKREPYMRGPRPDFKVLGPDQTGPNMEGPGPHTGGHGEPHIRDLGPEIGHPDMEGPRLDRRGLDIRGQRLERPDFSIEGLGPNRRGPGGPNMRRPGLQHPGPNVEGPVPDRRGPESPSFRRLGPDRRPPDMEGPESHRRGPHWGGADFGGSEPIQEIPDREGPEPDRIGRNLCPGPMRRTIRGPEPDMTTFSQGERWNGPDFRGSAPDSRGTDTEQQWSDERGLNMEGIGNERACAGDNWRRHGRGRGPVRDHPDMVCPGPSREGSGNEWREPERGGNGPNRWGPGQFFRGVRDVDNREQGHDREELDIREPGSDIRGGPDMINDSGQHEFRGNMRGPNMEVQGPHREGQGFLNSCPNRRGFEIEGVDRRRPRGPESRHQGFPGTDGRFSDCEGLGSERQGVDMESPGALRQGFDDFRRERRGSDMRRLRPDKPGMRGSTPESLRHRLFSEGPELDSRGSEPSSPHFNSPHQVARFHGPSNPHSAQYSGPPGPAQNSGGPGFDTPQNQHEVKPQRHRGALLPTPTEGLIRFPNRVMSNPGVFSPKQKQVSHSVDRKWSRGRTVSRERELVKGQKQQQEKSPAGKKSASVVACPGGGEGIKEVCNEADKSGETQQ
uniref:Death inducer-obliterator 1 n=2 Tax=Sparus aurata TaxID=8175 RepID=A0A671UU60_SPAAU